MTRPQSGLDGSPQMATSSMPLQYAYAMAVNKTARTMDVFIRGGGKLYSVPVLMSVGALPDITNTTGEPTGTDISCVVGYMGGDYRKPIILGLILPPKYETLSNEWLITHPTGLTIVITPSGSVTITRADGSSFSMENHVHSVPTGGATGIPQ